MNPPGLPEAELQKRTLTNRQYGRPVWLDVALRRPDAAGFAVNGWPYDVTDQEILERLLARNLEWAKEQVLTITAFRQLTESPS